MGQDNTMLLFFNETNSRVKEKKNKSKVPKQLSNIRI